MKLKSRLRSRLISLLFSARTRGLRRRWAEWLRRLGGKPHIVHVFLELDDPYSYLLAQHLPQFRDRYDIELQLHLAQARGAEFRPHPELLAEYAEQDCARIASELGVPFLDKGSTPPVEHRRALINALAAEEHGETFDDDLLEAIVLYWRGDTEGVARRINNADRAGQGDALLQRNQALLEKLGHYNAATAWYSGEWYWGIDRLHYLAARLDALGVRRADATNTGIASMRQVAQISLPVSPPAAARDLPPLEFFYSFRSPYSYLSLHRVYAIVDAFGLDLVIRPVLPMVMRGLPPPRPKILYIAADTAREAEQHGVPFGKFADPVGEGVERCLAVFCYAQSERKGRDFLRHAGEAIWAQRIDVSGDKGLRKVTGRTGLFWPDVKAAIEDDGWRTIVDENRAALLESGCWGVPTFRLGDFTVWGQDRLWLLVRHIEEHCDTGDGILV